MTIPPYRSSGDTGHIGDHNSLVDVLTQQAAEIADNAGDIGSHTTGLDPHGDRAYGDSTFSPLGHTHAEAVQSVNGQTGAVSLTAVNVGAISTGLMGIANGVATLDSGGKVPSAQLPSTGGGGGSTLDWENVKDYGAIGDGVTDDTAAILTAVSAAQSGTRKRPVYFPYGTYKMTQGITLADGLTMQGQIGHGREFDRRVVITNTTTDMFVYGGTGAGDSSQRPKDMVIQGITFSGNQAKAFITPSAIDASGAYPVDLAISFCGIKNFTQAFSGPALRLKILDSYINSCTDSPLNLGGSDNFVCRNFIDSYVAGSQSGKAVVLLNCQESTFSQNYVTCAPAMGIRIDSHCEGLRVVDNTINGLAQSGSHGGFTYPEGPGIYVASGCGGVIIANNVIANVCNAPWSAGGVNYDGAITVVNSYDISITGNTFHNLKSPSAYHLRITRISGTVTRIKAVGNVYCADSGDVAPRIAKNGSMSNILIDDETTGTLGNVGIDSTVTVTNTATESALCSYTLPAGTAVKGDTYRITVNGSADIGSGGGTITFRVRVGGAAGLEIGGLQWTLGSSALSNRPFRASFDVLVADNASSSTPFKCGGSGVNNMVNTGQTGVNYSSGSSNLTVDKDLTVTAKWSVADAAHILRAEVVTIEKLR